MLVAVEAMRPAAKEAQRLHSEFIGKASRTHAILRDVRRIGGLLKVPSDDRQGAIVLGVLPYSTMLAAKFDPVLAWNAIQRVLLALPRTHTAEETYLWACELDELKQLEKAVATLRRCVASYIQLTERLDQVAPFFSEPLFDLLDNWGSQQGGDFRLRAVAAAGTFTLKYKAIVIRYGHTPPGRELVALHPDMVALSQRGDWPGFDQ